MVRGWCEIHYASIHPTAAPRRRARLHEDALRVRPSDAVHAIEREAEVLARQQPAQRAKVVDAVQQLQVVLHRVDHLRRGGAPPGSRKAMDPSGLCGPRHGRVRSRSALTEHLALLASLHQRTNELTSVCPTWRSGVCLAAMRPVQIKPMRNKQNPKKGSLNTAAVCHATSTAQSHARAPARRSCQTWRCHGAGPGRWRCPAWTGPPAAPRPR